MGMVTHVLINNDCFSDILKDPEGFVRSIRDQMNEGGVTPLSAGRQRHVGWCAIAHHSSYHVAYGNDHTVMVPVPFASTPENVESPTVHQCCGCSCEVCAEGHNSIRPMRGHTAECYLRFDAATPENVEEPT